MIIITNADLLLMRNQLKFDGLCLQVLLLNILNLLNWFN